MGTINSANGDPTDNIITDSSTTNNKKSYDIPKGPGQGCNTQIKKLIRDGSLVVAALFSSYYVLKHYHGDGRNNNNSKPSYDINKPSHNLEIENNSVLLRLLKVVDNKVVLINENNNDIILPNMKEGECVYVDKYKIIYKNGKYELFENGLDDRRNRENLWNFVGEFELDELPNINTTPNNGMEFGDINLNDINSGDINSGDIKSGDIKSAIEYLKVIKDENWEQLTQNNTKEWIRAVQTILKTLGYNVGELDGIFGPNTKAAIEKFQEDNGLKKIDGLPGPLTITELLEIGDKICLPVLINDGKRFVYIDGFWCELK